MNLSFIISLIIIRKIEDLLSFRILNNFTTGTHMEKLSNHMENGSATIVQWVCLVEKLISYNFWNLKTDFYLKLIVCLVFCIIPITPKPVG